MREKRWLLTVAVVLCYAIQLCALPSKDKTVTLNLNGVSIENFLDAVKNKQEPTCSTVPTCLKVHVLLL